MGNLRRRCVYQAIREATLTTARREDFRICHLSIQHNHVHLLVEAADKHALASGMQGFQISAAKHLNAAIGKGRPGPRRRGTVFPDRYHAEIITSPTQARNAMAYVLCNFRKHREDQTAPVSTWNIDWFSSAITFPGWAEYGDEAFLWRGPPTYDPLLTYQPRTWLLREGWKEGWLDLVPRGAIGAALMTAAAVHARIGSANFASPMSSRSLGAPSSLRWSSSSWQWDTISSAISSSLSRPPARPVLVCDPARAHRVRSSVASPSPARPRSR